MKKKYIIAACIVIILIAAFSIINSHQKKPVTKEYAQVSLDFSQGLQESEIERFINLLTANDYNQRNEIVKQIKAQWHPAYIPITLEISNFLDRSSAAELLKPILKTAMILREYD